METLSPKKNYTIIRKFIDIKLLSKYSVCFQWALAFCSSNNSDTEGTRFYEPCFWLSKTDPRSRTCTFHLLS